MAYDGDEYLELKFCSLHKAKDKMFEQICELFNVWRQNNKSVEIVLCDNAGENIKLQNRLKSKIWKLNVHFEFTSRSTPQQNSLAEKAFDTIAARSRSQMNAANLTEESHQCAC